MPTLDTKTASAVCQTTPLRKLPGYEKNKLAYCTLPQGTPVELMHTFQTAPQFSNVRPKELLEKEQLRVLLFGTDSYYLRQAAAYLSAMHSKEKNDNPSAQDDFWNNLRLDSYLEDSEDPMPSALIEKNMTVISPTLLDNDIAALHQPAQISHGSAEAKSIGILPMEELDTAAILIAADSGPVLTADVLQKIEETLEKEKNADIFIALKPEQEELDLIEELRFSHGFQECHVGRTDLNYLRCLMTETADDLLISLDPEIDLNHVINHLRRYRSTRFTEDDIRTLLVNASAKNMPLKTEDLLFNPRSSSYKETGLNMLHDMIGLENIKNELNRMLATVNLDNRRRMEGIEIPPAWRNMAFSGSPGTGKSVTARLVAQILREEGCGSGRFVEAGREQLIGAFLGQTSPMIAKLFQHAKGGVLFIDEAGALLNNGNDIYATEAVNALVRHMELEPETIVIFATYPDEMQQLLDSNPGLSSRIAHVLEFCSYDEDQLFHIFCTFAKKERLPVANDIKPICDDFFRSLKNKKAENFGNGREARRLYLTAKEELALRTKNRPNTALKLTKKDLQLAATRLLLQENEKQNYIGFAAN